MTGKLKKFFQLALFEKWILLETCFYLTLSTITVRLIPFRIISSILGEHMAVSSDELSSSDERIALHIRQAIFRAKNNLPWKVVCLPMAMTAKMMLGQRSLESTLYMGVKKGELGELSAHAWLRVGELIVTGELEKEDFTIVASFA